MGNENERKITKKCDLNTEKEGAQSGNWLLRFLNPNRLDEAKNSIDGKGHTDEFLIYKSLVFAHLIGIDMDPKVKERLENLENTFLVLMIPNLTNYT